MANVGCVIACVMIVVVFKEAGLSREPVLYPTNRQPPTVSIHQPKSKALGKQINALLILFRTTLQMQVSLQFTCNYVREFMLLRTPISPLTKHFEAHTKDMIVVYSLVPWSSCTFPSIRIRLS